MGKNILAPSSECSHKQIKSKAKNGFETCLHSTPIVFKTSFVKFSERPPTEQNYRTFIRQIPWVHG